RHRDVFPLLRAGSELLRPDRRARAAADAALLLSRLRTGNRGRAPLAGGSGASPSWGSGCGLPDGARAPGDPGTGALPFTVVGNAGAVRTRLDAQHQRRVEHRSGGAELRAVLGGVL